MHLRSYSDSGPEDPVKKILSQIAVKSPVKKILSQTLPGSLPRALPRSLPRCLPRSLPRALLGARIWIILGSLLGPSSRAFPHRNSRIQPLPNRPVDRILGAGRFLVPTCRPINDRAAPPFSRTRKKENPKTLVLGKKLDSSLHGKAPTWILPWP